MTPPSAAKVPPSVLRLAGPLVVSFWMRAAFTFVDTAFAATIGDEAVAAIGLAVPFEFIMIAVWVGLSTGLTSCLSRAIAARSNDKVDQYLSASWTLIFLVLPVFLLLGGGIFATSGMWGLDPEVARSFGIYGSVLLGGSALSSFWSIIPDSMVKAHQDTRTTMWAGISSNITNLALNALFTFVFHWGIFGIALSTVLGRFAGLVYALRKAAAHERRRKAELADPVAGEDPRPLKSILALALPSSAAFVLIASESGIINAVLSSFENSTEALAAYSIYYRVMMFFLNPPIAIGVALLPFCAARVGSQDFAGLRRGVWEATLACLGYILLFVTPILVFGAPWLGSTFAESPLTAEYATFAVRLVPVACFAGAGFLLCRPVFEGLNRGTPGLIIALLRYLALTGPAIWAGVEVAQRLEQPPLYGVLIGLIIVAFISSAAFVLWLVAALRQLGDEALGAAAARGSEAADAELSTSAGGAS